MRAELADYLVDRLGVDLTSVDGLVVYLTGFDEKQAALFVRLRTTKPFKWKSALVGQHRGVDLVAVAPKLFSASVPGGLVLGTIEAVKAAIDRGGEAFAPIRPNSAKAILAQAGERIDGALAIETMRFGEDEVDRFVDQFGLKWASVTMDRDTVFTLRVQGDGKRMALLHELARAGLAKALASLEDEKKTAMAGPDVTMAVGAIVGTAEARRLFTELQPRLEGDTLVSRYHGGGSLASFGLVGAAAAVAIPAFTRYVKKSRTAEARTNLSALANAAVALQQEKGGPRFSFPVTTPWTPEKLCCGSDPGHCVPRAGEWEHPTWKALQWKALPLGANGRANYQYRFVSSGRGKKATFTVEASGDLDCNGVTSHFSITGRPDGKGGTEVSAPEIRNELE
jgi:type II secretory pathway pseudopilin PulG